MAEQTLYERLVAGCHAISVDSEPEHPFDAALDAVLTAHNPQDPPVLDGPCGVCGGTGVVHGPGQNGNWTDQSCGCDEQWCEECKQIMPCGTVLAIAGALGVEMDRG